MSETTRPSFGKRTKAGKKVKPIEFDLFDGEYVFQCKQRLQGAIILDFIAAAESDDGSSGAGHITELIEAALLTKEDRDLFNQVIRSEDPDDVIEIQDLTDIVTYLVEKYTSRPTSGSEQL